MARYYSNANGLITFSRASTATFIGSDGLIQTASVDGPRIDYDPLTGKVKGLLIEEERENLVTYSEDFSNAGWSKNGSTAIDSTLVTGPDGTLSGRRLLNFDSETGDRLVEVVSVSNATITGSIWVKGEGANVGKDITLVVKRNGGTFVADTLDHTLSSEWVRLDCTFTQLPDNTGASLVLKHPENGNEASEVLIYGAQLEAGSFATSYIPTSGSTVTRSADIASIPVSAFGYNQTNTVGTFFVEASSFGAAGSKVLTATNGSNRAVDVGTNPTTPRVDVYSNHTGGDLYNLSPASAGINKVAAAMAENNSAACANGGTVKTDTVTSTPVVATQLEIGSYIGGQQLNGHIKAIQYYPRRLTDAQLQKLT